MDWLSISIIAGVLIAFVTWMYWEMAGNTEVGKLPPCFIRPTGDNRTNWIFAFVIFNLFTGFYYFFKVYKPGRF